MSIAAYRIASGAPILRLAEGISMNFSPDDPAERRPCDQEGENREARAELHLWKVCDNEDRSRPCPLAAKPREVLARMGAIGRESHRPCSASVELGLPRSLGSGEQRWK